MAVAHRSPRVDLSGPTLLLGGHRPGAEVVATDEVRPAQVPDVVLVDLTGVGPDQVATLVTTAEFEHPGRPIGAVGGAPPAVGAALAAGVALVVLDVASSAAEVRAVAEAGVVLVLSGGEPADAVSVVDGLVARGIDPGRIVVEVGPGDSLADRFAALEHLAYGFHVGAALPPTPRGADPAAIGAEIGILTGLLTGGAVTVRGADARRFRRVQAVVAALDGAPAESSPPSLRPTGAPGSDGPSRHEAQT